MKPLKAMLIFCLSLYLVSISSEISAKNINEIDKTNSSSASQIVEHGSYNSDVILVFDEELEMKSNIINMACYDEAFLNDDSNTEELASHGNGPVRETTTIRGITWSDSCYGFIFRCKTIVSESILQD